MSKKIGGKMRVLCHFILLISMLIYNPHTAIAQDHIYQSLDSKKINFDQMYMEDNIQMEELHLDKNKKTTIDDIKKKYPHAKIVTVTKDEYEHIKAKKNAIKGPCADGSFPKNHSETNARKSNDSGVTLGNFVGGSIGGIGSSGGGGEGAIIYIFVALFIIVAAIVVYTTYYLVSLAFKSLQCRVWSNIGLRWSWLREHKDTKAIDGYFTGLQFSSGYHTSYGQLGLTVEVGHHTLDIETEPNSLRKSYEGSYFLIGPLLGFPFRSIDDRLIFQVEMLAGGSGEKEIGLISTMRIGLKMPMSLNLDFNINYGAAFVDLDNSDNYIKDNDNVNYIGGAALAYRW